MTNLNADHGPDKGRYVRVKRVGARREVGPVALDKRIARLEQALEQALGEAAQQRETVQRIRQFVEFSFDHAVWELPALSVLSSQYDQGARREQLGYLHACNQVYERMGLEAPKSVQDIILAMAGRKDPSAEPARPAPTLPATTGAGAPQVIQSATGPVIVKGP